MGNKILVFGGKGQLGQCLRSVSKNDDLVFFSSAEANICNKEQIESLFNKYKPEVIINCAAYTAVDKAEDEAAVATALNTTGPALLAELCRQFDVLIIHISTDFVFEGTITGLLNEDEVTKPTGIYGKTKLDGERAIQEVWNKHIIIRTSWLYSEYANNFVKTMLRLAQDRDELNIVADQVGTPTYAMDLASAILAIIDNTDHKYGLYHYSNEGVASWYDFAHAIFELSNKKLHLKPIKTIDFPTKARRPAYSVLDKTKIKKQFQLSIPHWRESLKVCLIRLNELGR
ncbi:dTDP-4-dehydrorhamnose reductase [Olivibacter domesticus]|uniref:dTDP-4-dehydrorhamnose reductase n=1 Tax=Olivibacter domesticus TaxID=407022 RepID=A0A1H7YV41_OLID1|nr:dTDP-4-dehydrorhamnose reductase [Olivibacter domesticus]SEM49217.1 dTDP-4-dehydrorhamnose reductase [Olivibacter domesticus]